MFNPTPIIKHMILGSVVLGFSLGAVASEDSRSFLDAVLDTLPAGAISSADRTDHYARDTWSGMKKIVSDGASGLMVPAFTIHPGWAYKTEKRNQENNYTWGGGVSKNLIDDRGNRRILYAMAFSDSHSNIEPFMGYGWLSRWRIGSSPIHAELGYTIGFTARGDYKWIPFPAPLPLAGIGTDAFTFYGTYVPFSNIFFFFANYVTDDNKSRKAALPTDSLFSNRFLLYAGGGWQKNDMKGMPFNATTTSEAAYTGGLRYFVTPEWALDFGVIQSSKQTVRSQGKNIGSFKLRNYQLTVQYHMQASDAVKLYAGVGAGYFRRQDSKFDDGYSAKKGAFSSVIQVGGTYAVTKNLHLTGGLDMGFARFKGHDPQGREYSMRPSPATFKIAAGFAF